ncbi:DUF1559 family PulG-like putative transporter [Candidatus Laterigemmans baculatus]|uniref:DUF1559 family PulG-like putative transporter n=1 Tax=Candidatus Laterigemmans baculatus TaxID=2770505 RepID=UPI0013DCE199|nr:DUF1559 domain-containing protein [Candidatus Laterigemmans baculatus]
MLVAKFDPTKLDPPELATVLPPELVSDNEIARQIERQTAELRKAVDALRAASGGQPIYATMGIPQSPTDRPLFFVLEHSSKVDRAALLDQLRIAAPEIAADVRDGKLIVAPVKEDRIDAVLDSLQPVPREELAAAFESVSSYPIQLLVLPPDYLRRTIEELVPRLPEEWGGGPSEIFTEGVRWAAVGVDPAELRAMVVCQSSSEDAAERLRNHLPELLKPGTLLRKGLEAAFGIDAASEPEAFDAWLAGVRPLVEIRRQDARVVLRLEEQGAVTAALPLLARAIGELQSRVRQSDHLDKFKQILLAMHNHHDVHGSFPVKAEFRDEEGKPYLSWRVHLLPYLDEQELFEQFRLNEPWDSPHNSQLVAKMPEIYRSRLVTEPGETTFLAPVGEDTVFGGAEPTRFQDMTDGTSNTVVLVEVQQERAVPWTAPQDYAFDPELPAAGLQLSDDGTFLAGNGDGSVQRFRGAASPEQLRRLFRKSDGNPLNFEELR